MRAPHVLLVDDEQPIRLICRVNLEAEGMTVDEAADGEQALSTVAVRRPDVAILDVMMPAMDGWEVARRLRAARETVELPLVFLTAVSGPQAGGRVAEFGGSYIAKPFNPADLLQLVRSAVSPNN